MQNDIKVDIVTHAKTGLFVATSEDLPGLYAHGRTMEDLERNISIAIKDIMEETLKKKVTVSKVGGAPASAAFMPTAMRFSTSQREAA